MAREQRKLAAIVAADVVGYSRLMGRDESGTVARLKQNRAERVDPILAKYGGRLVKLTGDGALAGRVLRGPADGFTSATSAGMQRPISSATISRWMMGTWAGGSAKRLVAISPSLQPTTIRQSDDSTRSLAMRE